MSRSRRRSSRRSAAEKTPSQHLQNVSRAQHSSSDSVPSVTNTPVDTNGSNADRYYAMAEEMNTRGAMELAVPFYRQAVALLLSEREALQEKLGGGAAKPVRDAFPAEALSGLLEAAATLGQVQADSPADSPAAEADPTLEAQIAELASELGKENALQVMAGLRALAETSSGQLPPSGLSLLAKAQMLLGQFVDGLQTFEAALAAAPADRDLQINAGAARLSTGDVQGALRLLRGVWAQGFDTLNASSQQALLRNLSTAEAKAGHLAGALQLRLKWFLQNPKAQPLDKWLSWAQRGLEGSEKGSPVREAALALLQGLHKAAPDDRNLLQHLADALEAQGDYRDASLLYRQLLRPQQS